MTAQLVNSHRRCNPVWKAAVFLLVAYWLAIDLTAYLENVVKYLGFRFTAEQPLVASLSASHRASQLSVAEELLLMS